MIAESLPRTTLRRTVLLALVPLAAIVVTGVGLELWLARSVHHDLVLLFEELREVAFGAHLGVDELRGVENWVDALPEASADTHPIVLADVHRHYDEASEALVRFSRAEDPSREVHGDDEHRLLDRVGEQLRGLGVGLDNHSSLGQLKQPITSALHAALAMSHAVDDESREIGAELDLRTDNMVQMLLVLGLGSILTVGGLGWLLLRRVLQPVDELRNWTVRFGRGEQELRPPIRRRQDELGDLAAAFGDMAGQLQKHQIDLEQRVEARSREVLRTAKLAQLGTLAAGIAHEINNPLASIVACSDGLLRDLREDTTDVDHLRDYLEILRKEAMRARDITTKLLRLAHDDQKTRELVWLGPQVQEMAALFAHQMEDAGVTLRLDLLGAGNGGDIGGEVVILGDAAEWRQVFFNLLRNALDASPRGGLIVVDGRRHGAEVEVSVQDQGPGISEELAEQVFEPFFTTKGPGKGTGLGLAIVHRIVTAHGGRIGIVDAAPGARVVITMPAANAS